MSVVNGVQTFKFVVDAIRKTVHKADVSILNSVIERKFKIGPFNYV